MVMSANQYPHSLTYTCIHLAFILVSLAHFDRLDVSLGPPRDQDSKRQPRRTGPMTATFRTVAGGRRFGFTLVPNCASVTA